MVICGTMTGELMPFQVIYQRKTSVCIPHLDFPKDGPLTYHANHLSHEGKMIQYIFFPYVQRNHSELYLAADAVCKAIH